MDDVAQDYSLLAGLFDEQQDAVSLYKPVKEFTDGEERIVDFLIVYCNDITATDLTISKKELIGIRLSAIPVIDKGNWQHIFDQCLQVLQSGKPHTSTYYNPLLKKHLKVIRSRATNGVLTIGLDRTEEVKAKETLQQQTDLTNSVLNASINSVFAMEALRNDEGKIIDFTFLKVNQKFAAVVGKNKEDIIGKRYLSLLPPPPELGLFHLKCHVVETGEAIHKEIYYKAAGIDGWFLISISRLGENGIVETFVDITEVKKGRQRLEDFAAYLQNIINIFNTALGVFEPVYEEGDLIDFRFKLVNKAFAAYTGRPAKELTGKLLGDVLPGYLRTEVFRRYKDTALTGNKSQFSTPYNKDELNVWVNIVVTRLGTEILVNFTDFTELKDLQTQLETKVRELERSNANLEEFAHIASHDLQEPLRKIQFFNSVLLDKIGANEETRNYAEKVTDAARRMGGLIRDLLDYSRLSHSSTRFKNVSLDAALKDVLTDYELLINQKKALIYSSPLLSIESVPLQMYQLFFNLLGNALKFARKDVPPVITITGSLLSDERKSSYAHLHQQKSYYEVTIRDNGVGFEQEYAEKIFTIFQRLNERSMYGGYGIGLALCKKIVDSHHGVIYAESKPKEGAAFTFILPFHQD